MALINCPECETEISNSATACPKCGFPIAGLPAAPSDWQAPPHLNGWFLVPAAWVPFMIIRSFNGFNQWSDKGPIGIAQTLNTSDGLAGFLVLGHLLLLILFGAGAVLFFKEKKSAPATLITAFSIQLAVIMLILVESADGFGTDSAWDRNWPIALIGTAMIISFVRSKRVKETFVK